jgi:hypothetical protein
LGGWYSTSAILYSPAYVSIRQHTPAYASIRQHTPAYVSIRQHTAVGTRPALLALACSRELVGEHYGATIGSIRQHTSAYVSIRQHTSAYVSIRQNTSAYVSMRPRLQWQGACWRALRSHYRQHTSAYVSTRQHTSAYVSIRQHTSAYVLACSGREFVGEHDGATIRTEAAAHILVVRGAAHICCPSASVFVLL